MKWVTRDFVHLDRVASPWLIKRYIDPDAVFVFVPWGQEATRPADAIPFALPGAEIGPHDKDGTSFAKLLVKHNLTEPSLISIEKVIAAGVEYALHGYRPGPDETYGQIAAGLLAISEGMMLIEEDDAAIIERSLPFYDALQRYFRAHHLVTAGKLTVPERGGKGPTNETIFLRDLLRADGCR